MELIDLQKQLHDFAEARNWRPFHNPKNLAVSVAIEAAELLERFQWLNDEQSEDIKQHPAKLTKVQDEMADVLIYLVHLADVLEVDLAQVVTDKIERNEQRFPLPIPTQPAGLSR